jgi:hypothetical protein
MHCAFIKSLTNEMLEYEKLAGTHMHPGPMENLHSIHIHHIYKFTNTKTSNGSYLYTEMLDCPTRFELLKTGFSDTKCIEQRYIILYTSGQPTSDNKFNFPDNAAF